jgi:hypothetical protein
MRLPQKIDVVSSHFNNLANRQGRTNPLRTKRTEEMKINVSVLFSVLESEEVE